MNWSGRQVLVTGAGGFIGSQLVLELARAGAQVRALVRYNARQDSGQLNAIPPELVGRIQILFGDLQDPARVLEAVQGVETVFHLGALIAIPYSYLAPASYVQVNVSGTLNVLEACRQAGVARLLQTSTSEVYGTAQYTPMDEQHPLHPQSPYAATKVAADQLALSYFRSFQVPVAIVRPFNNYGPGQTMRAVIPTILAQALAGDTIRLGSTESVRDFLYVGDTVRGFMAIAAAEANLVLGETFNLATGVGHSIAAVIRQIEILLDKKINVEIDAARLRPAASEVWKLVGCAAHATQQLGWQAETSLPAGLEQTLAWLRTQPVGAVGSYRV